MSRISKSSTANQENECCIGQHESGRFLWKANEYSVLWVLPSLTVFFIVLIPTEHLGSI